MHLDPHHAWWYPFSTECSLIDITIEKACSTASADNSNSYRQTACMLHMTIVLYADLAVPIAPSPSRYTEGSLAYAPPSLLAPVLLLSLSTEFPATDTTPHPQDSPWLAPVGLIRLCWLFHGFRLVFDHLSGGGWDCEPVVWGQRLLNEALFLLSFVSWGSFDWDLVSDCGGTRALVLPTLLGAGHTHLRLHLRFGWRCWCC